MEILKATLMEMIDGVFDVDPSDISVSLQEEIIKLSYKGEPSWEASWDSERDTLQDLKIFTEGDGDRVNLEIVRGEEAI